MNTTPAHRILVIEDDPEDARVTFRALRRSGRFEPVHVRSAGEALEHAAQPYDLFLVDCRLPDMSGIELVRKLRALGIAAPMVMLSSVQSDVTVQRAMAAGANDFLVKSLTFSTHLEDDLGRILAVEA